MNFGWITDIVFPPRCIGCDRWGVMLCGACRSSLRFLRTAAHLPRLDKQYFGEAYSALAYEGLAADWIHQFKYSRKFFVGRQLAALLAETPVPWGDYDFLVPVPLHWRRQWRRGFNPSRLLAHQLGKKRAKPVGDFLKRVRGTPQQTRLSLEARLKNTAGAFAARKPFSAKSRLLLIDDVLTTGSTVNECARVLKKGGAGRVDVLTLARTL